MRKNWHWWTLTLTLIGSIATGISGSQAAPSGAAAEEVARDVESEADRLPVYQPRFGRQRPVVVVVGENYYTELTDYVVPYGVLMASGAADVLALSTRPGPIRMFPAPMNIQPQATITAFDSRYPEGADYVIVPAVHRDDDPTLIAWVASQAKKGAVVVGVCDGVQVVAAAGLLEGRQATGHWYSIEGLRKKYPHTNWLRQRRYVADGRVITTTGVTATIPVSLALVEAIAGRTRALEVAKSLGGNDYGWAAAHPSKHFAMTWQHRWTIASNVVAFWSYEDLGIALDPGVDEISLALSAEVYSATFKSTTYTVAASAEPVKTRRGLMIIPDKMRSKAESLRMLPPADSVRPFHALDVALKALAEDYGRPTAGWVAMQMEYPGF